MTEKRRSTRHAAAQTPNYAQESSASGDEGVESNTKRETRRKRARTGDATTHANKVTRSTPKPKRRETVDDEARPAKVATGIATSSEANRDANGDQEVFWLLKAEPLPRYENGINVAFSIDHLAACTSPEPWSGVRNPQARNNMQAMRKGDLGFFYHSNAKPSGVVGILRIVEEAKVDETAFDSRDPYYDAKSERDKPKWFCTSVGFVSKFDEVVDLRAIKSFAGKGGELEGMQLVTNSRLSVSRVSKKEWEFIVALAEKKEGEAPVEDKR